MKISFNFISIMIAVYFVTMVKSRDFFSGEISVRDIRYQSDLAKDKDDFAKINTHKYGKDQSYTMTIPENVYLRPALATDAIIMDPRSPDKIMIIQSAPISGQPNPEIGLLGGNSKFSDMGIQSAVLNAQNLLNLKSGNLSEGFMGYPALNSNNPIKGQYGSSLGVFGFPDRDDRKHNISLGFHLKINPDVVDTIAPKRDIKFCNIFRLIQNNINPVIIPMDSEDYVPELDKDLCDRQLIYDHVFILKKFVALMIKKEYANLGGTEMNAGMLEELEDRLDEPSFKI